MRHKQILDVAAERPDAPVEEIAGEVPSATPDLVERVLEEHGDPAAADSTESPGTDHGTSGAPGADGAGNGTGQGPVDADTDTTSDGVSDENVDDSTGVQDGEARTPEDASVVSPPAGDPEEGDGGGYPSAEELSDKQIETLRAIAEDPDAPQRELSERLGVTAATISRRMNTIEGFEWTDREAFAEAVLPAGDGGEGSSSVGGAGAATSGREESADAPDASVEQLTERIAALEAELADRRGDPDGGPVFDDDELTHKVVKACVNSSEISSSEEVLILKRLLGRER